MDFQLSHARLRGALGALIGMSTIMLPVLGWQVVRYIDNLEDLGLNIADLSIKVAILSTQVASLQEDVTSMELHLRDVEVRKGNYVLPYAKEVKPSNKKL